jgi:hypothetical protein
VVVDAPYGNVPVFLRCFCETYNLEGFLEEASKSGTFELFVPAE